MPHVCNPGRADVLCARAFLCTLLTAVCLQGQTFEVASIKPSDPKTLGQRVGYQPGTRFTADNCMLSTIIQMVYGLRDFQIVDAPKWISDWTYRYDIQAKAATPQTSEQLKLMARALLAERFALKVHKETREMPVYLLVPAKKGLKLNVTEEKARGIEFVEEGVIRGRASIDDFIRAISRSLDRPVLDRTGFSGSFDFRLEWAPANPKPEDARASLFVAVQEQLGLKLEPQKAPVEVLVIDHAEQPSGN